MAGLLRGIGRIAVYARPQAPVLAAIVALSVAGAAAAALQPWPLKLLVDQGVGAVPLPPALAAAFTAAGVAPSAAAVVVAAAGAAIAVFAVAATIDALLTWLWTRAGERMVAALAGDLFLQLQRLSLSFHARRSVGDSLSRVTGDAWCVHTVVDGLLVGPVRHTLLVVSVGALAWQLDRTLTLLLLGGVPLLAASAWHYGARLQRAARGVRLAGTRLRAFVLQVLGAMPLVQVNGAATHNRRLYDALAADAVRADRSSATLTQGYAMVNGVATTAAVAAVVWVGSLQVLAGAMTVGALLVFVAYVRSIETAARALLGTYGRMRAAAASIDRVLEILDADEMIRDAPQARPLPPRAASGSGRLVFDGVTVGHDRDRAPVLQRLSLEVRAGETLALVGVSGAGKTTLASLVPRFVDPWEGRVTLDGIDLRDVTLASLRDEVAIVLQDPFILPLTVAENIAYGRPGAGRDAIVAAAVAAHADGFVSALPDGYDTVLDEQGAGLSGGQRQRIAIARALLKDPRVLILDEPTSALDGATESQVMAALARLMAGRTTIVIAHRPATVRHADRIACIDGAVVAEVGTADELAARGGVWARMLAAGVDDSAPTAR